jgi:phosphoheptose isomerase
VTTVALLGRAGGALAPLVDQAIVVPSDDSGRIQVIHLALEHLIVELVEAELTRGA